MPDLTGEIDRLLTERRPDRYEVEGGDEWLDTIADEVGPSISVAEARFIAARSQVRRREGEKLKATNRLLREIHESGEVPLDWLDTAHLPVAVGKERVALRAMRAEDFRTFAGDERRRAANDFTTRNESCAAAEWLADRMDATGTELLVDLGPEPTETAS